MESRACFAKYLMSFRSNHTLNTLALSKAALRFLAATDFRTRMEALGVRVIRRMVPVIEFEGLNIRPSTS